MTHKITVEYYKNESLDKPVSKKTAITLRNAIVGYQNFRICWLTHSKWSVGYYLNSSTRSLN